MKEIKSAAVIGSGVMGAAIAAQFLNAGISTVLLDIVPNQLTEEEKQKGLTKKDKMVRNRYGLLAIEKMKTDSPSPLTSFHNLSLLTIGNLEDDLSLLKEVDWIVEAIIEDVQIKKELFKKVDQYRKKESIVSSNTSGISINKMKETLSADFQAHFLGTHFFNPPRYIKLMEIIPTEETDPVVVKIISDFAEETLGKVVVKASDTPNFIANRIGSYAFLNIVKEMMKADLTIDEVDQLTGPLIGRPKSATFQTLDMVGLDTFYQVIQNMQGKMQMAEEIEMYQIPALLEAMLKKKMLGRKVGKGFYSKTEKGLKVLDYHTFTYKDLTATKENVVKKHLSSFLQEKNKKAFFLWNGIAPFLLYSAKMAGEITDSIYELDQAVQSGFNWKNGPFRLWDKLSLKNTIERMEEELMDIPLWIKEMIDHGFDQFYKEINGVEHYYHKGQYLPIPKSMDQISIRESKKQRDPLLSNDGASLIEIGDGVLLLELHSRNMSIGVDILTMIEQSIALIEAQEFKGLIIGSEKKSFSLGANLALMLLEAQNEDTVEIELAVRCFQQAMKRIKYCKKPVVAAPYQKTLGGGAEICLAASKVQASLETYIGLVETGVGLIPGGGGTTELYCNKWRKKPSSSTEDLLKLTGEVFQTILTAKVATSAAHAKEIGFFTEMDGITNNERFILRDAKKAVLQLANENYLPPKKEKIVVSGRNGYQFLMKEIVKLQKIGFISEYDAFIASNLATVLTGGDVDCGALVEEDYLLDLEREAFIRLIRKQETQQRMLHLLQTGKPLTAK
ncbi:3-hydroxyacyl-CoA dehydrogenase/enoyl-CoA hydratase family protein [Niallia hominis]|uniref:3-hydroxyacyl-CoA dehydrogenase NAD-binding domain-containing protein n=1 Tax=Niallia hominis TaxID=3133173 RepID=A0ABV1F1B6_9BACI